MTSYPPLLLRAESLAELRAKEVGPFFNPDGTLADGDWRRLARECSELYKENIRTWQALMTFTNKELMAERCNCNVEPFVYSAGSYVSFSTKLQYAEFMIQMFVCSIDQIRYAPERSLTRLVRQGLDEFAAGYSRKLLQRFNRIKYEETENGLTKAVMALFGAGAAITMGFAVGAIIATVLAVVFFFYSFNDKRRGEELASIRSEHATSNLGKMFETFVSNVKEPRKVVGFWNDHRERVHDQIFRKTGAVTIYITETGEEYRRGVPIPDNDTGFKGATVPDDEAES